MKLNPEDEYARRMLELTLWSIVIANPNRAYELLKDIASQEGEEMANKVAAHVFAPPQQRQLSDDGQAHLSKAEELFRSKQCEEAIVEYKQVIEENSNFAHAYMGVGDCYYMMGEFPLATEFFERSVAIRPDAPTYRYLGDAYMKLGDREKAIKAYQAAINTDPSYEVAKMALRQALESK